jgi:hypothetical protein
MALTTDLTRIKNRETVCFTGEGDSRRWTNTTQNIAFLTMTADIGEITAKNAEEFYCRICLISALYGDPSDTPYGVSIEDIEAHIGLCTNVVTITRAKFLAKVKRMAGFRMRDIADGIPAQRKATITRAAEQPATA